MIVHRVLFGIFVQVYFTFSNRIMNWGPQTFFQKGGDSTPENERLEPKHHQTVFTREIIFFQTLHDFVFHAC